MPNMKKINKKEIQESLNHEFGFPPFIIHLFIFYLEKNKHIKN
jgi:hypothetical protein